MRVPFADLSRSTRALPGRNRRRDRSGAGSWLVCPRRGGTAFEEEFAAALGAKHAVGVASGTDAIELALRALDVGPGDDVITQANTCIPTISAIERTGARPVLCDVEPDGATMSADSLERALPELREQSVPVHLYGQCADMDSLQMSLPRGPYR